MTNHAAVTEVARRVAALAPSLATKVLEWMYPAHAAAICEVQQGARRLVTLPATVAADVVPTLDASTVSKVAVGEDRPTVLKALGRPTGPRRRVSPPVDGKPEALRNWVEARSKVGLDDARAVLFADPSLAALVLAHSADSVVAQLCLDAAFGDLPEEIRPVSFMNGDDCNSRDNTAFVSALRATWTAQADIVWAAKTKVDGDPPWWRLAEAACAAAVTLRPALTAKMMPCIPEPLHSELVARVLPHPEMWTHALEWLARSGASWDTLEPLATHPERVRRAALYATDPECVARLTEVMVASTEPSRYAQQVLASHCHLLPTNTLCELALDAVHFQSSGQFAVEPCAEFLWNLASHRGSKHQQEARIDRDTFAKVCATVEANHPELFTEAVTTKEPALGPTRGLWAREPDRSADPLVVLWNARAERLGWSEVLKWAYVWPSAATAVAEGVVDVVDRNATAVTPSLLFELLDGWPGTLEELVVSAQAAAGGR